MQNDQPSPELIMLIIYSAEITTRLQYTLKVIFKEVLDVRYQVTDEVEEFENSGLIRINYSNVSRSNTFQIIPTGILSERSLVPFNIKTGRWGDLHTLFAQDSGDVPFDIFSSVFYLVTRYEEYLPFRPDIYDRFEANRSIAFCEGFLKLPVVDLWCRKMAEQLCIQNKCPGILPSNYRFKLTIDIDNAWRYRERGFFFSIGGLVKDLLNLRLGTFVQRLLIISGQKADPAYNFDYLKETEEKLPAKIQYFILCGKRGKYDKNISLKRTNFREFIRKIDRHNKVGIHPSFASNSSYDLLKEELTNLSGIVDHPVNKSRQHYLRLKFPQTYRNLIKLGIKEDHTLGYASQTGFRAGIARSFNYFDLGWNKETGLRIYPFQVMDRTLLAYQRSSPEEAMQEYHYFTETIQDVGGEFICLWHNDSLSDKGEWAGWKKVFEEMINLNAQWK